MIQAAAGLAQIIVFTISALAAAAQSPAYADGLKIEGTLEAISNHELIDAIIAAAPAMLSADIDELAIEPSAAASDWSEESQSGVDYAVTPSISLGVTYVHEEIEDLTADLIEMGTAGVDYTSHKVLVRAEWQFDMVLP